MNGRPMTPTIPQAAQAFAEAMEKDPIGVARGFDPDRAPPAHGFRLETVRWRPQDFYTQPFR